MSRSLGTPILRAVLFVAQNVISPVGFCLSWRVLLVFIFVICGTLNKMTSTFTMIFASGPLVFAVHEV